MAEMTRISVLEEFNKPLQIREIEIPDLLPGQVLIKITASGICGSDVHMHQGKDPRLALPMSLGHEGVGQIVKMNGEKKTALGEELKEGDMVIWNRGVLCGECYHCTVARQPSLCKYRWAYGIHKSVSDPPHLNGCYAEHLILDAKTDILLLDDRDSAVYVPASCSGATAAHAFECQNAHEYGRYGYDTGTGTSGNFPCSLRQICRSGEYNSDRRDAKPAGYVP